MPESFVPDDFDAPRHFQGSCFRLEPLGAEHNERDHEAWMSSIEHIRSTPGFEDSEWPEAMSLEANLADLVGHADDFAQRRGFTYSILDGADVIGCVYIYPSSNPGHDARVRSWVTASRSALDTTVWEELSAWLASTWPFTAVEYAFRT